MDIWVFVLSYSMVFCVNCLNLGIKWIYVMCLDYCLRVWALSNCSVLVSSPLDQRHRPFNSALVISRVVGGTGWWLLHWVFCFQHSLPSPEEGRAGCLVGWEGGCSVRIQMFLSELSVGSYFSVPSECSQRHPALPVCSPARVLRFQSLGSLVSSLLASDSTFMVLLSCLPSIHLLPQLLTFCYLLFCFLFL